MPILASTEKISKAFSQLTLEQDVPNRAFVNQVDTTLDKYMPDIFYKKDPELKESLMELGKRVSKINQPLAERLFLLAFFNTIPKKHRVVPPSVAEKYPLIELKFDNTGEALKYVIHHQLTCIDLRHFAIEDLDLPCLGAYNRGITELDLSHTRYLRDINPALENLPELIHLSISFCINFREPPELELVPKLQFLQISHCEIFNGKLDFKYTPNLKIVILRSNPGLTDPLNVVPLKNLEVFSMGWTPNYKEPLDFRDVKLNMLFMKGCTHFTGPVYLNTIPETVNFQECPNFYPSEQLIVTHPTVQKHRKGRW